MRAKVGSSSSTQIDSNTNSVASTNSVQVPARSFPFLARLNTVFVHDNPHPYLQAEAGECDLTVSTSTITRPINSQPCENGVGAGELFNATVTIANKGPASAVNTKVCLVHYMCTCIFLLNTRGVFDSRTVRGRGLGLASGTKALSARCAEIKCSWSCVTILPVPGVLDYMCDRRYVVTYTHTMVVSQVALSLTQGKVALLNVYVMVTPSNMRTFCTLTVGGGEVSRTCSIGVLSPSEVAYLTVSARVPADVAEVCHRVLTLSLMRVYRFSVIGRCLAKQRL